MKTFLKNVLYFLTTVSLCSCAGFLDIVPDNVATIDNAFSTRAQAKKYLFTCYSYLPDFGSPENNPALFGGDEMTCYTAYRSSGHVHAWYIQRGYQSATTDQRCNYWQGTNGGKDLYQAIRDCNTFLENIASVPYMDPAERDQWMAEVQFLKAYYHFYLVRMYGPVPIKDVNLGIDADIDEVRVYRNTLDECFDYIVRTLDDILEGGKLPDKIVNEATELGRITVGIVRAVKAEVLIYAASPLFNGNADYTNIRDNRGIEIFCPDKTEQERLARWRAAADACAEAIEYLEGQGLSLYHFEDRTCTEDTNYKLSIRGAVSEPWNSELIWGYTGTRVRVMQAQALPRGLYYNGTISNNGNASVSVRMAELFYTKNGVPIDEDVTWDYAGRFGVEKVPESDYALMKSGYETVKFNLDREYRFYADLCFDGNVWYGQGKVDESNPTYCQSKNKQVCANVATTNFNLTGIWPKKYVNKSTIMSSTLTYVDYPWPVIRLSGLYLYYAEALNECGESYDKVLSYINPIRARAGIPDVETSWDTYTTSPGKYRTQEGLRQIIHRERAVELCFEGQRFWDLRRWKEAYNELNAPFTGWTLSEETAELYFSESLIFASTFDIKDYFWPVPNLEIFANPNTLQNYGW